MKPDSFADLLASIRACQVCVPHLPDGPRPIVQASATARIVIIGQAPGRRVHQSGAPGTMRVGAPYAHGSGSPATSSTIPRWLHWCRWASAIRVPTNQGTNLRDPNALPSGTTLFFPGCPPTDSMSSSAPTLRSATSLIGPRRSPKPLRTGESIYPIRSFSPIPHRGTGTGCPRTHGSRTRHSPK